MEQSKKQTQIEAICGTLFAFSISTLSWWWPVPQIFDVEATASIAIGLTIYFTVISYIRNYWVRRFFNWYFNKT